MDSDRRQRQRACSSPPTAALVWTEGSANGKTREIKTWTRGHAAAHAVEGRDDRWFSPTGRDSKVLVSPDGKSVAFISDRSGWIHIYVMPVDATSESQAKQLTTGGYLAGLGSWSPDSTRIAYHRSEAGNQMERFINVVDVAHRRERADRHRARRQLRSVVLARRHAAGVPSHRRRELARPLHRRRRGRSRRPVRLSDSMPAGVEQGRLLAGHGGVVSKPPRQEAGAGDADGAEDARSHEEASGAGVDSRLGLRSELPRLASRQLSDVLLAVPVPRAAGLRDPDARLSRQLRLQPRLVDRRAHGPRRERHRRRGRRRRLPEDARLRRSRIASACSV